MALTRKAKIILAFIVVIIIVFSIIIPVIIVKGSPKFLYLFNSTYNSEKYDSKSHENSTVKVLEKIMNAIFGKPNMLY